MTGTYFSRARKRAYVHNPMFTHGMGEWEDAGEYRQEVEAFTGQTTKLGSLVLVVFDDEDEQEVRSVFVGRRVTKPKRGRKLY